MKRRLLVLAASVGLIGMAAGPATASASTGSASAWAATATRAEPTSGLAATGAIPAATPLRIGVALRLRDMPALQRDIADRTVLTPAQFESAFSPTTSQVAAVESYLRGAGFTGISATPNRVLVTADAAAGRAESAFHTSIATYRASGRSVYANTTAAAVPSSLQATVGSVLGLSDVGQMKPASLDVTRRAASPAANPPVSCVVSGVGYPCTYNPQGFWTAYDAKSASTGSATKIAIFAEGDLTQVIKDLRQEEKANALPQVPVDVVRTGIASSDTSGADEWDLDTQYSTGMAKTVKELIVYDATTLTDSDIAREFDAFVSADQAKAGSASFGECEYQAYLDGSMLADDEAFAQAAVQGQTVFASAGDTGGFCPVAPNNGVPAGVPDVNYPASSPYVVGVGGTTLVTNANGTYDEELAWLAGGGGVSYFEAAPAWQDSDGVTGTVAPTVCGVEALTSCGRTVPDISMDADPDSGANVYVDGTPEGVGGTSLSSPVSLGVWARVESHQGNRLGFASPDLYAANGTAAFHDITLGDTGPYPATPGYDLATGIGTFDVAKAETLIR